MILTIILLIFLLAFAEVDFDTYNGHRSIQITFLLRFLIRTIIGISIEINDIGFGFGFCYDYRLNHFDIIVQVLVFNLKINLSNLNKFHISDQKSHNF